MARTVWILGAGFSRSLGGPLLTQMFTPASQRQVRAAFPKQDATYSNIYGDAASIVFALYQKFGPHGALADRHWSDAEAYLEMLDVAATGPAGNASGVILDRLVQQIRLSGERPTVASLAGAARRALAAECSAFLRDADPVAEKWAPYRRWAQKVRPGDTIVSFNYDLVVETARDAVASTIAEVLHPGEAVSDDVAHLKLHGSVDWRLGAQGIEKSKERDFALRCGDEELVMASPGPTKQRVVQETLSGLWGLAMRRISEAEVIAFVGYRFPPTDSQARRRLVNAIAANAQTQRLALHVVLGPDTGHEHVRRLQGILEFAMASAGRIPGPSREDRSYDLRVHPLGAEDFLDLFVEGRLRPNA